MVRLKITYWEFDFEAMCPTLAHDILSQAHIRNKQTKRTWTQGHFTMLHPPSGTGCQTHYKMQQTLHLFGSSEISGSSLPISIRQFPVALLVSHDSFACRTNNVSFAAQHNVVKNNNNNHVLFYVLFLRIGAHRALQSKEGEKKTSVSVHVCAHTHIHVRLRTRTRTYACAHTHMYMCTCMHTHIHMLVHARAHTHTHSQLCHGFFHGHDESSKPVPSTSSDLVNNRQEGKQICEH